MGTANRLSNTSSAMEGLGITKTSTIQSMQDRSSCSPPSTDVNRAERQRPKGDGIAVDGCA